MKRKKQPTARTQNSAENSAKPRRGNPDKTKPYRFKKGESGNPGGRPRKLISLAYEKLALELIPNDAKKRTYADLLAEAQFREAIKGKTQAAREVTDRLEGKAMQPIELSNREDQPLQVSLTVKFRDPDEKEAPVKEEI
jgi:Family of unknown function (DUF5681)